MYQNSQKDIRIQQLLKSLEDQKSYINHIDLESKRIKKEHEQMTKINADSLLTKSFNSDQIRKLNNSTKGQGWRWNNESIEKAIRTRLACGFSGYNYLIRELQYPLPSIRTINRRLENLKLKPGKFFNIFFKRSCLFVVCTLKTEIP